MIPLVRDLSPESRDLLKRQIAALFPASGIAGLYTSKTRSQCALTRLEIRCAVTKQSYAIAYFPDEMVLIEAMPLLRAQMEKCRAEWRRRKRQAKRAA